MMDKRAQFFVSFTKFDPYSLDTWPAPSVAVLFGRILSFGLGEKSSGATGPSSPSYPIFSVRPPAPGPLRRRCGVGREWTDRLGGARGHGSRSLRRSHWTTAGWRLWAWGCLLGGLGVGRGRGRGGRGGGRRGGGDGGRLNP